MNFKPTGMAFPCDLSLVSLKNLVNSDLVYNGTSLILHRHGYTCKFPTDGLQCNMNTKLSLQTFLKDAEITDVRETTLTHMYDKTELKPDADFKVPPMELKTFKFFSYSFL
ncbi:hypothetical protein KUTeg_014069 [Tegillarca granosa]|uniref:Uncharacterized protein n=1 Tax=Tegillarca granosa TaxID=220873 RepID=A0ABQ9F0R3_TEGGR|nr:hypothetical protein KUTeg_014069 [Tegillarca granosa]